MSGQCRRIFASTVTGRRVSCGRWGRARRHPFLSSIEPPHRSSFATEMIGSSRSFLGIYADKASPVMRIVTFMICPFCKTSGSFSHPASGGYSTHSLVEPRKFRPCSPTTSCGSSRSLCCRTLKSKFCRNILVGAQAGTQVFDTGQTDAHCCVSNPPLHSLHLVGSITYFSPLKLTAPRGHSNSQAPH